jgi:hypothetical protein
LTFAQAFGKRTAVVDTERGSASLYADTFDFDVIELSPPFHPDRLAELIRAAEKDGYDTLIADSMSHFWEGEGGTLDIADAAGQRAHGNSFAGWKTATPVLRHLVDVILAADLHIIATMRSKQEWVLQETVNKQGRTVTQPVRVGMAPVMRQGIEYEFQLVGDLDLEHRLTITKSRVAALADQVIQPGRAAEAADQFVAWMNSGEPQATREQVERIKAMFAQIDDREARTAAKTSFTEKYGNPDYLLAAKVDEAEAFVSGLIPSADEEGRPFDD